MQRLGQLLDPLVAAPQLLGVAAQLRLGELAGEPLDLLLLVVDHRDRRRATLELRSLLLEHLGEPLELLAGHVELLLEVGDVGEVSPDMLGLFDGVPLPETGEDGVVLRPNRIYLFQRNLERMSATRAELDEQIRITLYHELGHYLGFEEEDMDDLGLA